MLSECEYYCGFKHGRFRHYSRLNRSHPGYLISEENYYFGKLHGPCAYYSKNCCERKFNYHLGMLHGVQHEYSENAMSVYKRGILVTTTYRHSNTETVVTYKNK